MLKKVDVVLAGFNSLGIKWFQCGFGYMVYNTTTTIPFLLPEMVEGFIFIILVSFDLICFSK